MHMTTRVTVKMTELGQTLTNFWPVLIEICQSFPDSLFPDVYRFPSVHPGYPDIPTFPILSMTFPYDSTYF